MSIQKIPSIGLFSMSGGPDNEHLEIMRRLRAYGVMPTGDKTADKNKLREIELKKAKEETSVSNKFYTVSIAEQEKIQEKKKEKRIENNPELGDKQLKNLGVKGEQIYIAIQLKKKKTTTS